MISADRGFIRVWSTAPWDRRGSRHRATEGFILQGLQDHRRHVELPFILWLDPPQPAQVGTPTSVVFVSYSREALSQRSCCVHHCLFGFRAKTERKCKASLRAKPRDLYHVPIFRPLVLSLDDACLFELHQTIATSQK